VAAHGQAKTPNPCVECNRTIKFDRLLERAGRLGFDALATGHHARVVHGTCGRPHELRRGADADKDQSYVLSMLSEEQLGRVLFPVGEMTKAAVRLHATTLGLRTAAKPDSQDVCFIRSDEGRRAFLADRLVYHPATVVDAATGTEMGTVDALELVTVGQRRGFEHGPDGKRRYVAAVDPVARRVYVGRAEDVSAISLDLEPDSLRWVREPLEDDAPAIAQMSAHGRPQVCTFRHGPSGPVVRFAAPVRPVAPGQTVAFYDAEDPDLVVGSAIAS
jgi:tRNA-specific 2-thiouridylase